MPLLSTARWRPPERRAETAARDTASQTRTHSPHAHTPGSLLTCSPHHCLGFKIHSLPSLSTFTPPVSLASLAPLTLATSSSGST